MASDTSNAAVVAAAAAAATVQDGTDTDLGRRQGHVSSTYHDDTEAAVGEQQPLLATAATSSSSDDHENGDGPAEADWQPPSHFVWIETALMANVFLYGFDGTITAATYAVISSEFAATNTASWLTTAYLVTSTAFQPLYGRLSDLFGRRLSFFLSTTAFALGCLGCGSAQSMVALIAMRALTGLGGGGLMTMATIVNSDLIPFRRRGMYQALQNGMAGFGAICGASFGGSIADTIGWRWCFLLQVPVSAAALTLGYLVIQKPRPEVRTSPSSPQRGATFRETWQRVDFSGALLLVVGISVQLVGLSLGGNELPWGSPWVVGALVGSGILLALFVWVEARTTAIPVIPLRLLKGRLPVANQVANVCSGFAAYAYLFMLPLFFQVVLLDSATKAGARLALPSLATPVGGLIAGVVMSRWGRLGAIVRTGSVLMAVGNGLAASLGFRDSSWKYWVYIVPANLGQGLVHPGTLFTSLATFGHADHAVSASTVYLVRSLGTVWGVAVTSAILQTTLTHRLPDALEDLGPDKWRVIDAVRHSVEALKSLPPQLQLAARHVYYDGIRLAFVASTAVTVIGIAAAFLSNGKGLRRTTK